MNIGEKFGLQVRRKKKENERRKVGKKGINE